MTSFYVFWDLKISNFVKLNIVYHPFKFQMSWLSGLNFIEVSVRPPKTQLQRYYDVISYHCVSKLAYFIEHGIGYQPEHLVIFDQYFAVF